MSREDTIAWGITGPLLRAAGVPYDVRKAQPYWVYDRMEFEIALGKNGDNFDRYLVRMAEMEQSMRIAEQALDGIPGRRRSRWTSRDAPSIPQPTSTGASRERPRACCWCRSRSRRTSRARTAGLMRASNVADKRVMLPPKETAYGSIEGLMNHFMLVMEGYGIRPPAGEAYFPVEGANGELGFYVVSDGSDRPYRVRCRPPCLPPVAALPSA